MTVGISDGVQLPIQMSPASIYSNNKEYRVDEFHVGVVFDVSEFSSSATEKLLHAQLSIKHQRIVDKDGSPFALDHLLEMRGLPIYVFEETDMAQIVKEESDDVKEAVEQEQVGKEAEREVSGDLNTELSEIEKSAEDIRAKERAETLAE